MRYLILFILVLTACGEESAKPIKKTDSEVEEVSLDMEVREEDAEIEPEESDATVEEAGSDATVEEAGSDSTVEEAGSEAGSDGAMGDYKIPSPNPFNFG